MTAAVAGAAARSAGAGTAGRAAAGTSRARARNVVAARSSSPTSTRGASIGGGEHRSSTTTRRRRTAAPKPAKATRPPSSKGYVDAVAAGDVKRPDKPAGGGDSTARVADRRPSVSLNVPGPVSSGAGFVLGLLFWAWVGLPFLRGGPAEVRAMLRAKFTNKTAGGEYLK